MRRHLVPQHVPAVQSAAGPEGMAEAEGMHSSLTAPKYSEATASDDGRCAGRFGGRDGVPGAAVEESACAARASLGDKGEGGAGEGEEGTGRVGDGAVVGGDDAVKAPSRMLMRVRSAKLRKGQGSAGSLSLAREGGRDGRGGLAGGLQSVAAQQEREEAQEEQGDRASVTPLEGAGSRQTPLVSGAQGEEEGGSEGEKTGTWQYHQDMRAVCTCVRAILQCLRLNDMEIDDGIVPPPL